MNHDLTQFRARLNGDPAIQERVRRGEDPVALAQSLGYDVSREDIEAAVRDDSIELTEFELELVSGGAGGESKGTLLGTVFGGPIIGTATGDSIAGQTNDQDESGG